jgi:hypothetical protein
MLFIAPPENAHDVRAFCARFSENIRVEYKNTFDENVRRNLPKVLSSFANSLGGVLVVGVNAQNGVPQQPMQGFANLAEELPLTIENICFQNINPPVIPRIHIIPSDVEGRSFAVIEVDESWEAPHAIENSTKVYVRTGNAANPYDLANVDLIIELVRRRAEPAAKRQGLLATARNRANNALVTDTRTPYAEMSASPEYPRHALCTRDDCWNFMANSRYRGGHYFPVATVRRVEDGIASYNRTEEYGQVSRDGVLFIRRMLHVHEDEAQRPVILLREILHPTLRLLHCAEGFYRRVSYRGGLTIEVTVNNIRLRHMLFLRQDALERALGGADDFQCFEDIISVSESADSEQLSADLRGIVQNLMRQMCWSFWQSHDPFPVDTLNAYLQEILHGMGFR